MAYDTADGELKVSKWLPTIKVHLQQGIVDEYTKKIHYTKHDF